MFLMNGTRFPRSVSQSLQCQRLSVARMFPPWRGCHHSGGNRKSENEASSCAGEIHPDWSVTKLDCLKDVVIKGSLGAC